MKKEGHWDIRDKDSITNTEVVCKKKISEIEIGFLLSGYGKHIVPLSISSLNNEYVIRYNLDGLISFNNLEFYNIEESLGLLRKIIEAIRYGQEFILDLKKFELSRNTIFFSKENQKIIFLFNPSKCESVNEKIIRIMENMEGENSIESRKAFKKIKREISVYNLSLESIIKLIDKELEHYFHDKEENEKLMNLE